MEDDRIEVNNLSEKIIELNNREDDDVSHLALDIGVYHEAFAYVDGQKEYVQIDHEDLYPYLLANIRSGVSMIKVDSDSTFERVSGTSIGGGTFLGLGLLLTQFKCFDELLELSRRGNNRVVDMLVRH